MFPGKAAIYQCLDFQYFDWITAIIEGLDGGRGLVFTIH